jgi:tRNA dimethylallyltransferase
LAATAEPALAITGPTASGKSAVALEVARRIGGELISVDSRQVYRGMDIGTAKATAEERAAVPHHGLDLVDPGERYSAGRFAREARAWVREIRARAHVPVLVGGTGFFLRALLDPLFAEPPLEPERRERLRAWLAVREPSLLRCWAAALDPAGEVGADPQRLARRLEVALLSGRPLSWWQRHAPAGEPAVPAVVFVLELPRAELYRRIDERVHRMVAGGLLEEVARLAQRGSGEADPGMNATGYIELLSHLRGERTLSEAVVLIQNATRAYARRQLTWFGRQLPADAIRVPADRPVADVAADIVAEWRRQNT